MRKLVLAVCFCSWFAVAVDARGAKGPTYPIPQEGLDTSNLEVINGRAEVTTYRGRPAVHLAYQATGKSSPGYVAAVLKGTDFKDGTIEAEVAGTPLPGADPGARGFIGIAFRVQPHASRFECFYLRPTNGRATDQLRRNHSVQYESVPDFPWYRLRRETPGVYESYVDIQPGVWTKLKIVVAGTSARLYVNDATEPTLIVNDLKLGESHGQVAFWGHESTDAYFGPVTIK
jgi:hypothetical protein